MDMVCFIAYFSIFVTKMVLTRQEMLLYNPIRMTGEASPVRMNEQNKETEEEIE